MGDKTLPEYCDLTCQHAAVAEIDPDTTSTYRPLDAIYCSILEKNVMKDARCHVKT